MQHRRPAAHPAAREPPRIHPLGGSLNLRLPWLSAVKSLTAPASHPASARIGYPNASLSVPLRIHYPPRKRRFHPKAFTALPCHHLTLHPHHATLRAASPWKQRDERKQAEGGKQPPPPSHHTQHFHTHPSFPYSISQRNSTTIVPLNRLYFTFPARHSALPAETTVK